MNHKLLVASSIKLYFAILVFAAVGPIYAATFTVTKVDDTNDGICDADCSLREAILAANMTTTVDIIMFDSSFLNTPRVIVLNGSVLAVDDALTINGTGAQFLTISGNNASRIFVIGPDVVVTIREVLLKQGNGLSGLSPGFGGAIYNQGTLALERVEIRQCNASIDGGGLYNSAGHSLTISNSSILMNTSARNGGGLYNDTGGITEISGSTVGFNKTISSGTGSVSRGGGINNRGTFAITGSAIIGNEARFGGGIENEFGGENPNLMITNSTLSGNKAEINGGGLDNNAAFATLKNATIANNIADSDNNNIGSGGGIYNFGQVNSRNTIIADNISNSGAEPDYGGGFVESQGYNLIENVVGLTIRGDTTGNITGQDPKLGVLATNGGPTKTHSLLVGSPAIDAGNSSGLNVDQRGLFRPFDFPAVPNRSDGGDMGAFERRPTDSNGALRFDFDGDRKNDISIFRPSLGEWWYLRSSDGDNRAFNFGLGTDMIVASDYSGDAKSDVAFWRPTTGEWFILRSEDSSFYSFPFGNSGDIPIPADYDGDGKADPAIFRSSSATWFILNSSGGTTIQTFGANGDRPVPADYDGDNHADIAIFRPSDGTWWLDRSQAGLVVLNFGTSTDKTVQGDYTGDGKADVAFWRPTTGEWFISRSEDFSFYSFPFGTLGDISAPGDYDGDGKIDPTVFRPSNNTWYKLQSTNGFEAITFGITNDIPVPTAFVR